MTTQTIDVGENHYVNSSTANTVPALTNQIHTSPILSSLFKFTLPAAPAGEVLQSASLVVRTTTASTAGSIDAESIYLSDASTWSESTVTWNTRPALGALVGIIPANSVPDTVYTVPLDTSLIEPLAGTTIGFSTLGVTTSDSLVLWSSRHATPSYRPDLVLVYGPSSFDATFTGSGTLSAAVVGAASGLTFRPKAEADALVGGPAIVSTIGITTTLTSATFIPPTASPTQYAWRGATGFAAGPTGSTTVWAPNSRYGYAWNSPPVWGIEFVLTGTTVELSYQAASGAYSCFRIKVNGQRVSDLPVQTNTLIPAPTGGQRFMLKLTFATSGTRRITMEGGYLPFGGMYTPPGSTVSAPPPFNTRLIIQGDSIVASSAETPGLGNGTWVPRFADYCGADDPWNIGVGGTGFLNATPVTFINRMSDLNHNPDAIIFFGGFNDRTANMTTLQTAAEAVFDASLTQSPSAEHYVFGCWVQAWPIPAANIAVDNALRAAAAASGIPFASCTTGNCYDAAGTLLDTYEPIIRSSADVTAFIGSDGVHPNGPGNNRIAEWGREVTLIMSGSLTGTPYSATFLGTGNLTAQAVTATPPSVPVNQTVNSLDLITINASADTTPERWEIEQTGGITVAINGGAGSWSVLTPYTWTGTTLVFRIRYLANSTYSDWASVSYTVRQHEWWVKESTVEVPYTFDQPVSLPSTPDPGLFFKIPEYTGPKLFMGHFYPPYPKRIANVVADGPTLETSDYYNRNYVNPVPLGSSEQAHIPYGGILRTRPMPLPVVESGLWEADNARREIREALDIGLDGFFCNTTSTSGANVLRIQQLRDMAVAEFPGFIVTPMLDFSAASPLNSVADASIAAYVASFAGLPCTHYLPDGRMVIGSFQGDGKSAAWWTSFMALLASSYAGLTIAVMGSYNAFQTATEAHKTVLYASGQWGYGADPNVQNTSTGLATEKSYAAARNIQNLRTIWMQDIRPFAGVFDEARNTEALRAAWTHAIQDNVEHIEMCTFGDLKEGSDFRDSESRGRVGADISAWYASWWKTGTPPAILKDVAYLTHRQAPLSAVPTGPQTQTMQQWVLPKAGGRQNPSALRESVEALVFLTAPAEVRITSNGTTQAFSAPAGMSAWLKPAGLGPVAVEVWRGAVQVIDMPSPIEIKALWPNDHKEYAAFGSIRGTTGQRASWPRFDSNPQPVSETPWLPFEMPASILNPLTTGKWTLTHPMDTYYVSIENPADNVQDYWEKNWLYNPVTPASSQNVFGGVARQRYARRSKRPEPSGQFEILDYRWEVRAARLAGIDAFTYAVSQRPPGSMFVRVQRMLTACAQENAVNAIKFYCIPWILGNTGVTGPKLAAGQTMTTAFVQEAANYLADYFSPMINDPLYAGGFLKIAGETVFMPYNPEKAPNSQGLLAPLPASGSWGTVWWQAFKDRMTSLGTPVKLWMTLSDSIATHSAKFESLSDAQGWFGSRDWALSGSTTGTSFGGARNYLQNTAGLTVRNNNSTPMPYIAPVSTQGYYPRGETDNSGGYGYIWEAKGTQNLINSCTVGAVNQSGGIGTEIFQVITWNDVAEGTQVFPSTESGWHWLDLLAYFNVKHKTGSYPTPVRDGLYLTHRRQQTTDNHAGGGATYSGVQTKFATRYHDPATGHAGTIESPLLNIVDCVAILTAAATVEVTSGGITTTFSAPAGFSRFESPLRLGTVSARIIRGGTAVVAVTSPTQVSATQVVEDLTYYGTNNFRNVPRPVPVVPN